MALMQIENNRVTPTISKVSMLLSALFMGNVGLLVTFFSGYPVYTIVLLRGIFGTFFLTLFMIKTHSFNKTFFKEVFKLHWLLLIVVGIVNPLIIYLYFVNITISGYAIAAFLLYTSGVFVLGFILITKEEEVPRINIVSFALAIVGVALIMEFWTGTDISSGLLFGILSGITLAILVFCKKKMYNKRDKIPQKSGSKGDFDMFLAWWPTLFIIVLFLPLGYADLVRLTPLDLILALVLGLIPTALAFWLYNVGVKNDKGGNIIILAYFEPVMAVINTIIFLQVFSIFTIIGGSLIILANIIVLNYSK